MYGPLKAGDFSHPLLHKLTVVKAGVAGLYVYHELKLALGDAPSIGQLASGAGQPISDIVPSSL
ncbi:MAG: hypothetical protein ABSH51_25180 [Solirubrobacteraceae bacterium]|jgi:hypothetical protein